MMSRAPKGQYGQYEAVWSAFIATAWLLVLHIHFSLRSETVARATFAKHCTGFSSSIAGLPCHLVVFGDWSAVVCGCRVESLKSQASVKALVDSELQNAVWYKPGLQR